MDSIGVLFFLPRTFFLQTLYKSIARERRRSQKCPHLISYGYSALLNRVFFYVMLNNQLQIFRYNGSPVTFQKGGSVMVNATEMAKPFGKTAKDFLRNQSTQELISTLSAVRQICPTELVKIVQGGSGTQGT